MGIAEVFLLGVGLSMDAFAVSVGKGLGMRRVDVCASLALAASFGVFQALMPVLGWALASTFAQAIESVDHWIAFGLLAAVGGKMLFDGIRGEGGPEAQATGAGAAQLDARELLVLSIATSIDALAVGITFAALSVPPFPAVLIIGATTFAISLAGVVLGNRFGARYEGPATVAGGVILVLIGLKVLAEHLSSGM